MSITFSLTRWLFGNKRSTELNTVTRRLIDFDDVGTVLEEDLDALLTDISNISGDSEIPSRSLASEIHVERPQ